MKAKCIIQRVNCFLNPHLKKPKNSAVMTCYYLKIQSLKLADRIRFKDLTSFTRLWMNLHSNLFLSKMLYREFKSEFQWWSQATILVFVVIHSMFSFVVTLPHVRKSDETLFCWYIYIFIPVCWSLVSRGNKTNRTGTDYCDLSGLDIVSLCACLSLIKQFWELFLSSLCLNSSSSFVLTVGLKYLHRHTVSHHQDQEKK